MPTRAFWPRNVSTLPPLVSGFAKGARDVHPTLLPVVDITMTAFCAVLRFLYTGMGKLKEASVLDTP